jgi:sigma-B regulation protein RsbU (phosphoserine phosphatase)
LALEQLESTDTIIERWDLDGVVLEMNQFGLDLFGFSADEIIGRNGNETFRAPGGGWETEREELLANPGQSVDSETECRRSDGTAIWVAWRNSPILDEDNNVVEVVSIGIDITERRGMELQVKAARDRMEGELNIAADIQMSMLPLEFPAFPERREFSIHAMLQPAREVGGDFYDFFLIDHDHLCFCVGDVSDKGVPAALFMAVTKTLIGSHAASDWSPASIMTAVNRELCVHNESSMFVTIFLCILDLRTGEIVYTNAGHNPPYIKTADGDLITLDQRHGMVAGAVAGIAYGEDRRLLSPGDYMILFTDGVTEAMSPNQELYSDEALERLLGESTMVGTEQGVKLVYDSVVAHQDIATQSDDITILIVAFDETSDMETARLEIAVVNTLKDIGAALASLGDFAKANDVGDDIRRTVLLTVDDLLNNIVSYAYEDEDIHHISVVVKLSSSRVSVSLSDDGIPFNPFGAEVPNTSTPLEGREEGGLGIHLVRSLMDEYDYERRAGQNIVTIAKRLGPSAPERTSDGNNE